MAGVVSFLGSLGVGPARDNVGGGLVLIFSLSSSTQVLSQCVIQAAPWIPP